MLVREACPEAVDVLHPLSVPPRHRNGSGNLFRFGRPPVEGGYAGASMALVSLALLGVALALGLFLRGEVRSSRARLLRTLVPSWRFFAEIDAVPILEYQVGEGPWREGLPPVPRGIGSLVLNGPSNLRLAEHGVVEALLEELDGLPVDRAPSLLRYRMVQAMVEARMREAGEVGPYAFRLVASDGVSPDEEVFRSVVHRPA